MITSLLPALMEYAHFRVVQQDDDNLRLLHAPYTGAEGTGTGTALEQWTTSATTLEM